MPCTFARTYVSSGEEKKHFLPYSLVPLSLSLCVLRSSFLALFCRLSLVLLCSSILQPQGFFAYHKPFFLLRPLLSTALCSCVCHERRESRMMRGLYHDTKCFCRCVRVLVCVLIDYSFYLSATRRTTTEMKAMRRMRARHCCQPTSNRTVVFVELLALAENLAGRRASENGREEGKSANAECQRDSFVEAT